MADSSEHTLEFLLAFDGRVHWYQDGYFIKFEIGKVQQTELRPHGLSYSFTLHGPDGRRLLGFDNAHPVAPPGGRYRQRSVTADHWHRRTDDVGEPYAFVDAETLINDFFDAVERTLAERGVPLEVIGVDEGKVPMAKIKIQKHSDLRTEMAAVARGDRPAPKDAAGISFQSADLLLRLLTPDNRKLLRLIRDQRPRSVAELARLSQRAQPNVLRTLGKLEAFGMVRMDTHGNRKVPVAVINRLSVTIDPFSSNDVLELA